MEVLSHVVWLKINLVFSAFEKYNPFLNLYNGNVTKNLNCCDELLFYPELYKPILTFSVNVLVFIELEDNKLWKDIDPIMYMTLYSIHMFHYYSFVVFFFLLESLSVINVCSSYNIQIFILFLYCKNYCFYAGASFIFFILYTLCM